MRKIIKRYPPLHENILWHIKSIWRKDRKEYLIMIAMVLMMIDITIRSSVHATTGILMPPKIAISPAMGSEPTYVDFTYMTSQKNHTHLSPASGALVGINTQSAVVIPKSATINWTQSLRHMWIVKMKRKDTSLATKHWAHKIIDTYSKQKRDTKSVSTFIKEADASATNTQKSIDYPSLCHKLNIKACGDFKNTMNKIRGRNLVAYGMTEIFPTKDGEFNYSILDTILNNAGENYLDDIPSAYDGLLSKGFYQMTSYAIRRDDSGNIGGVNLVDNYAGKHLSGSIAHLKEKDSHKAAFEFAVDNIGNLMKSMSEKDAHTLSTKCSVDQLTQVIAIMHHAPRRGAMYSRRWIHDSCSKPIKSYLDKSLSEYSEKTRINYRALKMHQDID